MSDPLTTSARGSETGRAIAGRVAWALAVLTWLSVLVMLGRDWLGIGGPARPWLIAASTGFLVWCASSEAAW
ncbi:MAG: hypothetical protein ACOX9R_03105 [Armatimonadota bacterium]